MSAEPPPTPDPDAPSDASRRVLLKYGVVASAIIAAGGISAIVRFATHPVTTGNAGRFPRVKVANVSTLVVGQPVYFAYPLDNEPNLLVKLGVPATGGVGPDGDIVAFSQVCQHLGCNYGYLAPGQSPPCNPGYKAAEPVGYCCCHGSVFDFTNQATVVAGPSPRPQPQVHLDVDASSGDIFAVGMGPPAIFGHGTGSNDVSNDLQGGTPVG